MIIWLMNRYVVISLSLLIIGHWAVLMQGSRLRFIFHVELTSLRRRRHDQRYLDSRQWLHANIIQVSSNLRFFHIFRLPRLRGTRFVWMEALSFAVTSLTTHARDISRWIFLLRHCVCSISSYRELITLNLLDTLCIGRLSTFQLQSYRH